MDIVVTSHDLVFLERCDGMRFQLRLYRSIAADREVGGLGG